MLDHHINRLMNPMIHWRFLIYSTVRASHRASAKEYHWPPVGNGEAWDSWEEIAWCPGSHSEVTQEDLKNSRSHAWFGPDDRAATREPPPTGDRWHLAERARTTAWSFQSLSRLVFWRVYQKSATPASSCGEICYTSATRFSRCRCASTVIEFNNMICDYSALERISIIITQNLEFGTNRSYDTWYNSQCQINLAPILLNRTLLLLESISMCYFLWIMCYISLSTSASCWSLYFHKCWTWEISTSKLGKWYKYSSHNLPLRKPEEMQSKD